MRSVGRSADRPSFGRLALAVAIAGVVGFAFRPGSDGATVSALVALFGAVFIAAAALDLERRLIPNRLVYGAAVIAAAVAPVWPGRSIGDAVLGAAVALTTCVIFGAIGPLGSRMLRKPIAGLGAGDLKLLMLVGLVAGWPGIVIAIWVTTVAAAVSVGLVAFSGSRGRLFPFGPAIAAGGLAALAYISLSSA